MRDESFLHALGVTRLRSSDESSEQRSAGLAEGWREGGRSKENTGESHPDRTQSRGIGSRGWKVCGKLQEGIRSCGSPPCCIR